MALFCDFYSCWAVSCRSLKIPWHFWRESYLSAVTAHNNFAGNVFSNLTALFPPRGGFSPSLPSWGVPCSFTCSRPAPLSEGLPGTHHAHRGSQRYRGAFIVSQRRMKWTGWQVRQGQGAAQEGAGVESEGWSEAEEEERAWSASRTQQTALSCWNWKWMIVSEHSNDRKQVCGGVRNINMHIHRCTHTHTNFLKKTLKNCLFRKQCLILSIQ